jgi:hypothetical protein
VFLEPFATPTKKTMHEDLRDGIVASRQCDDRDSLRDETAVVEGRQPLPMGQEKVSCFREAAIA